MMNVNEDMMIGATIEDTNFTYDEEARKLYNLLWGVISDEKLKEIGLTKEEREKTADAFIAKALVDEETYELLKKVGVYVCMVMAKAHKDELKDYEHAVSYMDLSHSMYLQFLKTLKKLKDGEVIVKDGGYKKYIVKTLSNEGHAFRNREQTLFSAMDKVSSANRPLVRKALSSEGISQEEYDKLTPEQKQLYQNVASNKYPVSIDAVCHQSEDGMFGGSLEEVLNFYKVDPYETILDEEQLNTLLDKIPGHLMRKAFVETYLIKPANEKKFKFSLCKSNGKQTCSKLYGVDDDLYQRLLKNACKYVTYYCEHEKFFSPT